jgi:predicted phosphodiesterase
MFPRISRIALLGLLIVGCTSTPIPVTVVPSPEPLAMVRGPYIQSVTTSTVIVAWEQNVASPGSVAYGESESYDRQAETPEVGLRQAVTITGLSPYTIYHYQVLADAVPLSEGHTFRTAAGSDQTQFSFAAFGDTRTGERHHRAVVNLILPWEPDFAVHTGDLVAHGHSNLEWREFFEIEQELMARTPLYPSLGNHEANNPLYRQLFYLPGNEFWYSFDYGHAHFVALRADGLRLNGLEEEQLDWLQADLAATEQPWRIVFFHIPPYSSRGEEEEEILIRQQLVPILTEYGVQLVFNGHDHNYQRSVVDEITYVVTGGGGAPLYTLGEWDAELIAYASEYHALQIIVDGPTLTAVAVSVEGEELDRFTLELP